MNPIRIKEKMTAFLLEDIGQHDVTASTVFPQQKEVKATFYAKESGVLAGSRLIETTYELIDKAIVVECFKQDGETVTSLEPIATVTGSAQHILSGERVILNMMQRMSGIATTTQKAVAQITNGHTRICDTRKTTPGLRMFEKYAVTCGGGFNHRNGLYDGVMIKDNHIAFCGSIKKAVHRVKDQVGPMVKIEVETETEDDVLEAVEAGAHIIMFDNMTPAEIMNVKKHVPSHIITEASGGITMDQISAFNDTFVDYISLGFLTHSFKSLDIHLSI